MSIPTFGQESPASQQRVALQGVNVLSLTNSTQVFLSVERPVRYQIRRISRPPRVVIEFQNANIANRVHREFAVSDEYLRRIDVRQEGDGLVRVTLNLNPLKSSHYSVISEPPAMLVEITPSGLALETEPQATEPASTPEPTRPVTPPVAKKPATKQTPSVVQPTPQPPAPRPSQPAPTQPRPAEQTTPARSAPKTTPAVEASAPKRAQTGHINGYSKIYRLEVEQLPDRTRVFVGLQRVGKFRRGTLKNPERLYIDFPGMQIAPYVSKQTEVADSRIKRVRLGQFKTTVARVVLDLEEASVHRIETQASPPGMIIEILKPDLPEKRSLPPQVSTPQIPRATQPDEARPGPVESVADRGTPEPPPSGKTIILAEHQAVTVPFVKRPPKLADFLENRAREAEAKVTGFRQRNPQDGAPVSEETTAFLSHDGANLYIVFDCKDDPSQIRSRMNQREQINQDDQVIVYLDTSREMRHSFIFAANPLGIQRDGILTEAKGPDYRFDTVWHSEGRLTTDGFLVWIKIPLQSLRSIRTQDQDWVISLGRLIQHKEEYSYWPGQNPKSKLTPP
ncbi:MAG: AMIN domain-containing protein [Acidobacteriota bacterium]|nr:MAG: AMIN domain-containing protein [Acidobacteriota bacterium]